MVAPCQGGRRAERVGRRGGERDGGRAAWEAGTALSFALFLTLAHAPASRSHGRQLGGGGVDRSGLGVLLEVIRREGGTCRRRARAQHVLM